MNIKAYNILCNSIAEKIKYYSKINLLTEFVVRENIQKYFLGYIKCMNDLNIVNNYEFNYLYEKLHYFLIYSLQYDINNNLTT